MKLDEQIEFRMKLEELISQREGMIAENKQREACGQSMCFSEQGFQENAEAIRILVKKLIKMGES